MENIPDAVVGVLLQNLIQFVKYNADLIGGAGDAVHNLMKDLQVLTESYRNDFLEIFAADVRDLTYEAEDAIETYVVNASRQKLRGSWDKILQKPKYLLELRHLGKEIEHVSKRVQSLYDSKANLGLVALNLHSGVVEKKKKVFYVEEDNVIGLDDEAEKVIELLTGESQQLEVISVIGMLGLGKTALARKIFKHPTIVYKFLTNVFIHVSQDYDRKEVFLKILEALKLVNDSTKYMSEEALLEVIREELRKRQYLVVMDDVWTVTAWDDLKVAFPNNGKSSRVLITSRLKSVALHANSRIPPHELRFMYLEESKELLRRKVFGENFLPTELEEYESCILHKCKGLPLAIVVVAGILLNNRDRSDWWRKVVEGVDNFNPNNQERTIDIIKMSYNNLPYHLRPCFLYLGIFPEDMEIPVWKLLRLWIAEGFVPWSEDGCFEDIAQLYLEELVDRNLVILGKKRSNGQIKTCHIHDTLRDFCKNEAIRVNIFQEIRNSHLATSSSSSVQLALDKCRRLCINANVLSFISMLNPSVKSVRSFLSFADEEFTLPQEHVSKIPKELTLLRVLDIRSVKFPVFPLELYYLVLLRYLAISCNINKLGGKFNNLWNLQTFILETPSRDLEITADIWKMAQLRHLHVNESKCLIKIDEETAINESLQTLTTISSESCGNEVFDKCPNLRKLAICGKLITVMGDDSSTLFDSLLKLQLLENLKLLNDDVTAKLTTLPRPDKFPSKLTKLTLSNTFLDWKHMSTLGNVKTLETLKLKDNAFCGDIWETEDGGFQVLKVLNIGSTNLVEWKASASHFPKLTSLIVRHCVKLQALPPSLAQIHSLEKVELHCNNQSVAYSARKIQLLKLELQAQQKNMKKTGFKLSVYPPDD